MIAISHNLLHHHHSASTLQPTFQNATTTIHDQSPSHLTQTLPAQTTGLNNLVIWEKHQYPLADFPNQEHHDGKPNADS